MGESDIAQVTIGLYSAEYSSRTGHLSTKSWVHARTIRGCGERQNIRSAPGSWCPEKYRTISFQAPRMASAFGLLPAFALDADRIDTI